MSMSIDNSARPTNKVELTVGAGDASTSRLVDHDQERVDHMTIVAHGSDIKRLEAQLDAALAAFAHLAPRLMHAAEFDDLASATYLLALKRGLDWLEDAGLSFDDAKQARIRIVDAIVERDAA